MVGLIPAGALEGETGPCTLSPPGSHGSSQYTMTLSRPLRLPIKAQVWIGGLP